SGLSQRNVQRHAAVRLERRERLHGHAFLAEVEDHAACDPIKAGKGGRVHLLAKTMSPFGSHVAVHDRALSKHESGRWQTSPRRMMGAGRLRKWLRTSWLEKEEMRSTREGTFRGSIVRR